MGGTLVTGRPPVDVLPADSATTVVWKRAAEAPSKVVLRYPDQGAWRDMTWKQLADRVRDVAAGLVSTGIEPGDRVALMSSTRVEWTVADLAILAAGAVTVPIYETSSAHQCEWILADSDAKVAVVGTPEHAKTLAAVHAPKLGEVLVLDDGGLDALAERAGAAERREVDERVAATTSADLFSIIYTSGTTGNPKGCMLSHHNMVFTARQSAVVLDELVSGGDAATLLFLPLAHVFARLVQFLCLEADVTIGYARSIETLSEDLRTFRPTFLLSVPRVFEKVFSNAQRKAEGPKRKIFDFAVTAGTQWSEAVDAGRAPGLVSRVKHAVAAKLVYGKLNDALGGRLEFCVSGGAPLAPHLAHFFHAAGITILEGYGLTETTAPAAVNTPARIRIGTVGLPLPGVEISVADDGEILIRGGNVFVGYHGNDAATREVLTDDGWLRTGDLGEIDDDGFLRITGRKKEIIVTAGGKNVAPAVLEERLKAHRLVSQAMVVGDNRPFIGALVTLDPEELEAFATRHGLTGDMRTLAQTSEVRAEVDKAVDLANAAVSQAEAIRKAVIIERDFSIDDDELTPTLKVRRAVCAEHFAGDIERLYQR